MHKKLPSIKPLRSYPNTARLKKFVGWVEQSETQQSLGNVGFRSSNATCFKSAEPPNAVAPQPTKFKLFELNRAVLVPTLREGVRVASRKEAPMRLEIFPL
ncbi:hypothetical protein [Nostoc commune]|uniref:hypothetical protein n=1 Tax=Nostoc commune TaxID=1178 RepID=UPI002074364C|nr:hypothetical protein [Nostoc commune]